MAMSEAENNYGLLRDATTLKAQSYHEESGHEDYVDPNQTGRKVAAEKPPKSGGLQKIGKRLTRSFHGIVRPASPSKTRGKARSKSTLESHSQTEDHFQSGLSRMSNRSLKEVFRSSRSAVFNYRKRSTSACIHLYSSSPGALGSALENESVEDAQQDLHRRSEPCRRSKSSVLLTGAKVRDFGKESAYKKLEALGEGSYATVYRGFSTLLDTVVAMKEITLNPSEGAPFTAIREASLLKGLKHANIVTLHDIIHTKTKLTFVFEYVETDLSKFMECRPSGLPLDDCRLLLFQLLRGLQFCHERRILHRDLKPQNILISRKGELKLADFGLARAKSVPSHTYSNEVVTLWYRPPDVLLGTTDYSTSLDMWGVGCIFAEMMSGTPLFPGLKNNRDQLKKIWQVLGTPTEESWPGVTAYPNFHKYQFPRFRRLDLDVVIPQLKQDEDAQAICEQLLRLQPQLRLKSEKAVQHRFFSCLPKELFFLPPYLSIFTIEGVKLSVAASTPQ